MGYVGFIITYTRYFLFSLHNHIVMQSFDTKDSNTLESFDRKFESFESKHSEVEQSDNDFVESFDRKFESFESKGSEVEFSQNGVAQKFDEKFKSSESKDTKVDGRSKPRTRKQIDAYKRNFSAGKAIEKKIYELDKRVQCLQQLLLKMNGTYR